MIIHKLAATALRGLEAEKAHSIVLKILAQGFGPKRTAAPTPRVFFGKEIQSYVGIAAGADKNIATLDGWRNMGAGLVTFGSVRRSPHPGNPMPRVWRFPAIQSTVNWKDLDSLGADVLLERLDDAYARHELPADGMAVGVSLVAPSGRDAQKCSELAEMASMFSGYADYYELNVSCPNTGEEQAQNVLDGIAGQIDAVRSTALDKPLLIKLAPTHDMEMLEKVAEVCIGHGANGFVCCNTMVLDMAEAERLRWGRSKFLPTREEWPTNASGDKVGGLSGQALLSVNIRMLQRLNQWRKEDHKRWQSVTLVGVGGVLKPDQADMLTHAGADFVQVYNGLIYNPNLIDDINHVEAKRRGGAIRRNGR